MTSGPFGRLRIVTVVGARPNFPKVAALMEAYRSKGAGAIDPVLVHTGQHYDAAMSGSSSATWACPGRT